MAQAALSSVSAPAPDAAQLIATLNPEQRQAVEATEGAVLVVAGAGTGKTRVLTTRTAYILATGKASTGEILAVTFTNKAANEMKERIHAMIGMAESGLEMGSFHSVSLRMLRRHARAAGLKDENFIVIDEDDQLTLIEAALAANGFTDEGAEAAPSGRARKSADWKDLIRRAHSRIQYWKEEGWTPEDVRRKVDLRDETNRDILKVYRSYQDDLKGRNVCDFADLLLYMVKLFRDEPRIREFWAKRFRYILVDEFQDTNPLQYEWLKHLASGHGNLCCVGDLDQCIYQWRNARPEIMIGFQKDWKNCRIISIHRNYRSTQPILDVANAVVDPTPRPVPKELISGIPGEPVRCKPFHTAYDEAEDIAGEISRRIAQGDTPSEIAILLRTSYPMRIIEQKLHLAGIHYIVVGGVRFFDREEIKDSIAYLRIFMNPADELAFKRICNKPARNIGDTTLNKVLSVWRGGAATLAEACRDVAKNGERITKAARQNLEALAFILDDGAKVLAESSQVGDAIEYMLSRTRYLDWRRKMEDDKALEREENLIELIAAANEYTDTASFLQHVATMSAADEKTDDFRSVRISTIHAAKGLEFDTVFSPAVEEGILPHGRALQEPYGEDEERRIAHVAWTRARKRLFVSCSFSRNHGATQPSRFLQDAGLLTEEEAQAVAFSTPPQPSRGGYGNRRLTRRRF